VKILAISEPTWETALDAASDLMDAEIAKAQQFYLDGLIEQAYMDFSYTRAYLIIEAPSLSAARTQVDSYPRVIAGAIRFTLIPLVGMPAVASVERQRGHPLPSWWPGPATTAVEQAERR
jgi:hypothetical protein